MSDIKKRLQDAIELEDAGFSAIETDDTIFEDALAALHQQNQAEPTEYHAWAVVDAIDHDHANISDTVGYVFKALKAYHAMSAAPQPNEAGE